MTPEEISEGNKLISEFMGWNDSEYHKGYVEPPKEISSFVTPMHIEDFKYHSSWDWLMPAVIKTNKMNKMVTINLWSEQSTTECKIYNWGIGEPYQETECENPLESVYKTVVAFIKWYNTNTLPK